MLEIARSRVAPETRIPSFVWPGNNYEGCWKGREIILKVKDWAPKGLEKLLYDFQEHSDSLGTTEEDARLVHLLGTDDRMESVWRRLAKRSDERELSDFAMCLWSEVDFALKGPSKFWDITPSREREKTLRKGIELSKELATVLDRMEFSQSGFYFHKLSQSRFGGKDWNTSFLHDLEELGDFLEALETKSHFFRKRPVKEAEYSEVYFIRSMNMYFSQRYDSHLDDILSVLVNVVFEKNGEKEIDRDYVRQKRTWEKF